METNQIFIPQWLKREKPICAGFCEMINAALQDNPYMSLSEFAEQLNIANTEDAYKRLLITERKQLGETI